MAYTPETIVPHQKITSAWGNKIEQHLARLGNYLGVISDASALPDPSTVSEGDWYLVSGLRSIYVAQGGKWVRLGGATGTLQTSLKIDLFDTAGAYEGLYYAEIAFTDKGPSVLEAVARVTANLGQNHKLKLLVGADFAESPPFSLGTDQVIVVELSPNVTPPAIKTAQVDILFNMNITGETPSGVIDGINTSFNLVQYPVSPGSVVLTVDGTTTVTDDENGNLSDGGTIDYATGMLTLGVAPTTSLSADYEVGKIKNETPSGTIDGTNTSFTLAFTPIVPATVRIVTDKIVNEIPSGTIDGANTSFTLSRTPIIPTSVVLTVDESSTVTDDGAGNLSDGGTIDYETGALTLGVAPTTSLTAIYGWNVQIEYLDDSGGTLIKEVKGEIPAGTINGTNTSFTLAYTPITPGTVSLLINGTTTITDDGNGNLSDGGTIDYTTGTITLAAAPTTSLSADYTATNGTIDYETGALNLTNAPSTSLSADYEIVGGYIDLFELRWF